LRSSRVRLLLHEERSTVVKVLVGKKKGDKFPGFWAEFEGERVSSYEDPRLDKHIFYTLYKCTAYDWEAYRVHIEDESNPATPVYELRPYEKESVEHGIPWDYTEPYRKEQIEAKYPLFLKDMDHFIEWGVDQKPRNVSRQAVFRTGAGSPQTPSSLV
jgi:hypothetical protein